MSANDDIGVYLYIIMLIYSLFTAFHIARLQCIENSSVELVECVLLGLVRHFKNIANPFTVNIGYGFHKTYPQLVALGVNKLIVKQPVPFRFGTI